jgi:hypothetical protein
MGELRSGRWIAGPGWEVGEDQTEESHTRPRPSPPLSLPRSLVIIDFLIRHGYLTPEQSGYLQLVAALRSGDCS